MKRFILCFVLFVYGILDYEGFCSTVRYVNQNNPVPLFPYITWATAATNIQDAAAIASSGDLILVTNGLYQYGGISISGSNRVHVPSGATVQSVNGPAVTTIKGYQVPGITNGSASVRCAMLEDSAILSGFTLAAGATASSSLSGGGVMCNSTRSIVTNCTLVGNVAGSSGGGAYNGTLVNCMVCSNIANYGSGGGAAQSSLINCIIAGNRCGYIGGATISGTLVNCTVVNNVAEAYDGAIDSAVVQNSIVYNNFAYGTTPDSGPGYYTNCCVFPPANFGANNITNAPAFVNFAGMDLHLSPASPCINAGKNSFATNSADLDGNARIANGIVDMGAYEFQPAIHYVTLSGFSPIAPYTNWTYAATTIQDAVDASIAGDFVVVSNGNYQVGARVVYGAMTNRVVVDKAITIQSVNGPTVTAIVGAKNTSVPPSGIRCIWLTNGAVLNGFTLTNGSSMNTGDLLNEKTGGGAWCNDNSAVISNCVLCANSGSSLAGGAYRGTLINCTLSNNLAGFGAGGASNAMLYCTLTKNSCSYNNGNSGGGAYYGTLSNCVISGNTVLGGGSFGGGAFACNLTSCAVSNNTSGNSGGGVCFGATSYSIISSNRSMGTAGGAFSNVVNNSLIVSNVAGSYGGAYLGSLVNCTVAGNLASSGSGGAAFLSATNCIIYYNTGPKLDTSDVIPSYCCNPFSGPGSGNVTNPPNFADAAHGNFRLQTNSACINSGKNVSAAGAIDLDGAPRTVGGTIDIGAYEFQTPGSKISYAYLQSYGLPTDGSADFSDSDSDGLNNFQEWITGTSPIDSTSSLKMLAPTNGLGGIIVRWQSMAGRNYTLERAGGLVDPSGFQPLARNMPGLNGFTSFTDTNVFGGTVFYRVSANLP
jgi:hypothetical protein